MTTETKVTRQQMTLAYLVLVMSALILIAATAWGLHSLYVDYQDPATLAALVNRLRDLSMGIAIAVSFLVAIGVAMLLVRPKHDGGRL